MKYASKLKREMEARLASRRRAEAACLPPTSHPAYEDDPHGYIRDVLGVTLTPGQSAVVDALMAPPHKVLVPAGHSVGKTMLAACLVSWFFDTHYPSRCLTTAPTERQVIDLLWGEVRILRARAGLPDRWVGPRIPRLESGPEHFAQGYTARDSVRFHGHHSPNVMIVFDEAEGVAGPFWIAADTMRGSRKHYHLCIYNPLDNASGAAQAEQKGTFTIHQLSCMKHPNIEAERRGEPPPVPGAVTTQQVMDLLREDSTVLPPGEEPLPTDVELGGVWYRPGPVAEARILGRRPSESSTGVWGPALWEKALQPIDILDWWPVAVGCDVGRYGDDSTVIMVRKGPCLIHVESHVKQPTNVIAERLKHVCEEYADQENPAKAIPVRIDEGGVGGGVIDQGGDYLFIPINASRKPRDEARYDKTRAELWFTAREAAMAGVMDLSRLPPTYLKRLKAELMVAKYRYLPTNGKIQVMPKEEMKELLGRSPDLADTLNLTYYPY